MATGSLGLNVTDPDDEPINGRIRIELEPVRNPAGGTNFIVGDIECRGGPGTLYTVRVVPAHTGATYEQGKRYADSSAGESRAREEYHGSGFYFTPQRRTSPGSADRCFRYLQTLTMLRQDRFFL
jgi:hypothetical protein